MIVLQGRKSAGFSLIEILLVLALVAILLGIVSGNASAFILGTNAEPPDRVLKRAALDALYFSSEQKEETFLSWFEENATFLIKDKNGVVLQNHSIFEQLDDEIRKDDNLMPKVVFYAVPPNEGIEGGASSQSEDELYLPFVRFHSGCSTPFRAQIEFRGEEEELKFDPFSAYLITQDK